MDQTYWIVEHIQPDGTKFYQTIPGGRMPVLYKTQRLAERFGDFKPGRPTVSRVVPVKLVEVPYQ